MYVFDGTAMLYDLDLVIFDVTGGDQEVARSSSREDNTETIAVSLEPGRAYRVEVRTGSGLGALSWDYALARQTRTDTDGGGVDATRVMGLRVVAHRKPMEPTFVLNEGGYISQFKGSLTGRVSTRKGPDTR